MGFGVTVVCTVAAYTSRVTQYDSPVLIPYWSGIVSGGNCSLLLDTFTGDAGSLIEVFNITTAGQQTFEPISCNISTSLGCQTNFFNFTGLPYEQNTFDLIAHNGSGNYQAVNWTFFILPPVPSQPLAPMVLPGNTQVQYTTSMYSSEYGAPLTGCITAAGPFQWSPAPGTFPSTLNANGNNKLPSNSVAKYSPAQNTNITVNMADMNLKPNTTYDFWVVCYNSNGMSMNSVQFNQTTSSSLPTPKNSASGGYGSALVSAVVAAVMWTMMAVAY